MNIPDAIVLLRDFTAWALLVFLVVGGMRGIWVWGWQYRESQDQNKRLQEKLDEQGKVMTDTVGVLGKAIGAMGDGQRVFEALNTLKEMKELLEAQIKKTQSRGLRS